VVLARLLLTQGQDQMSHLAPRSVAAFIGFGCLSLLRDWSICKFRSTTDLSTGLAAAANAIETVSAGRLLVARATACSQFANSLLFLLIQMV